MTNSTINPPINAANQPVFPGLDVHLEYAKGTGKKTTVTASRDGVVIHSDQFDVAIAKKRDEFVDKVCSLGGNRQNVEAELLGVVKEVANRQIASDAKDEFGDAMTSGSSSKRKKSKSSWGDDDEPPTIVCELDPSSIARAERIIMQGLSAIAAPATYSMSDGTVMNSWSLYTATANGRGKYALGDSLTIDGRNVPLRKTMFAPTPDNVLHGWSRVSRDEWLAGGTVDIVALYHRLHIAFADHVDLVDSRYVIPMLACYVALTFNYHAWPAVPYLLLNGPRNSGKSRLADVIQKLCFNPLRSDSVSPAVLFRSLDSLGGTLIYDESERLRDTKDAGIAEVRTLLLAGYQRGRGATRIDKIGEQFVPHSYTCYGPKVLANINGLDETLASRCIKITTQRAKKMSQSAKRRMDRFDWQSIRDDLYRLALAVDWNVVAANELPSASYDNRDRELWAPLLSIAAMFDFYGTQEVLMNVQACAAAHVAASKDDGSINDLDRIVLEVLWDFRIKGLPVTDKDFKTVTVFDPTATQILSECRRRDTEPFAHSAPNSISRRLGIYGIRPTHYRNEKKFEPSRDELLDVAERYGLDFT